MNGTCSHDCYSCPSLSAQSHQGNLELVNIHEEGLEYGLEYTDIETNEIKETTQQLLDSLTHHSSHQNLLIQDVSTPKWQDSEIIAYKCKFVRARHS